jgi:hypothetical protein
MNNDENQFKTKLTLKNINRELWLDTIQRKPSSFGRP